MGEKIVDDLGQTHVHRDLSLTNRNDDVDDVIDDDDDDDDDAGTFHTATTTSRHYRIRRMVGRVGACAVVIGVICLVFGLTATIVVVSRTMSKGGENPDWIDMRWEDDGTCLPERRMAKDGPIYCNNGNGPISSSSDGTSYCGGVIMEPNSCVLPTTGKWASPSSGGESYVPPPPLPRHFGIAKVNAATPLCETMGELISGNYKGEINDQEWVPKTCHAVPMSPFAWTRNTKCQATITMMGDGHVRNLFTATINGLRGVRAFAEAHENREAKSRGIAESYFWRLHKDGTASDRYAVHVDTYARNADIFEDCPCDEVEKCLRIAFVWAPKFEDQLRQLHVLTNEKSDVVIVSPGNAAEPIDALPYIWTAAFDDLLREYENLQLGVVHYPFGMQPEGRAAALAHWTTNNTAHAGRMSFLNQKEMKHVPTNSKNMTKYACGLGKVNVENDNIIAIKPCTDLTDAAHVRALITVHLDALG